MTSPCTASTFPRLGLSSILSALLSLYIFERDYFSKKDDDVLMPAFLTVSDTALPFVCVERACRKSMFKSKMMLICRMLRSKPQKFEYSLSKYIDSSKDAEMIRNTPALTGLLFDAVVRLLSLKEEDYRHIFLFNIESYCAMMPFGPTPNRQGEEAVLSSLFQCDWQCYEDALNRYPKLAKQSPVRKFIFTTVVSALYRARTVERSPHVVFPEYLKIVCNVALQDRARLTRFLLVSNFEEDWCYKEEDFLHYLSQFIDFDACDFKDAPIRTLKQCCKTLNLLFYFRGHYFKPDCSFAQFLQKAGPRLINQVCFENKIQSRDFVNCIKSEAQFEHLLRNGAFAGINIDGLNLKALRYRPDDDQLLRLQKSIVRNRLDVVFFMKHAMQHSIGNPKPAYYFRIKSSILKVFEDDYID